MKAVLISFVAGILLTGAAFLILGRSPENAQEAAGRPFEQRSSADILVSAGDAAPTDAQNISTAEIERDTQLPSNEEESVASDDSSAVGNVRIAQALPTASDFNIELRVIGRYSNGLTIPEIMAAEPRDDRWASGTESFLYAETVGSTAAPLTEVQTECRTTWCGVVIEVPESIPHDDQRAMYLRIMKSVGSNESESRHYIFGRPNDSGGHIVFYYRVNR